MKRTFNLLSKYIWIISLFFVLWIVGVFLLLPVIPFIETNYHIVGTNQTLSDDYILKQKDNTILRLEVDNGFPEYNQCFDFSFLASNNKYILTVKDFSQNLLANKSEIKRKNLYLFLKEGSKDETSKFENYLVENIGYIHEQRCATFRSVYDVSNINNFSIKIKTNYQINNKPYFLDTTLQIVKEHKLTWNRFRVH